MKSPNILLAISVSVMVLSFLIAACSVEQAAAPVPEPTRDPVLEQSIEQQLEAINPEAVPVYREATEAMDNGATWKSKALYEKILLMAPEFATVYRRLSYIESYNNNLERAESLARKAIELEPNAYNQTALARVLLQKDTPRDSQEAYTLISAAEKDLPDDEETTAVLIMAAGDVNQLDEARQATERLLRMAPYNPLAHYYTGLFAAVDGNWLRAEKELLASQQLGMPPEAVREALASGIGRNALFIRLLLWSAAGLVAWLIGLGILYLLGSILSRATMRALAKAETSFNTEIQPEERQIRSIYRAVINVLSLYFYISIPFIILALFLVVGGAFYLFFLIGRIPIQLALILVVMLFVSLSAIIKSLVSRIKNIPLLESLQGELDKQFEEAMSRVTSEYDSHPAPQERIRLVERLRAPYSPLQDNPKPALHLFPNPEALQIELTTDLMKKVQRA